MRSGRNYQPSPKGGVAHGLNFRKNSRQDS
jgi:hypothetical protein